MSFELQIVRTKLSTGRKTDDTGDLSYIPLKTDDVLFRARGIEALLSSRHP